MSELLPLPVLPAGDEFEARLPQGELRAAKSITSLQVNLGLFCNLACKHCHVGSSPIRTAANENMSSETAARLIDWLGKNPGIKTIDLTGGSPEANPQFRKIVSAASQLGIKVMDRCNPTIISYRNGDTTYDWIPTFLAEHQVTVIASLPCYLEENVQKQRGLGSFDASIDGLQRLNAVGYGKEKDLSLHLVYNPNGPHLPPPQESLADAYHRELAKNFGIEFNELWTITNMPIQRWRDDLERQGKLDEYMRLLVDAYNADTIEGLMCRHQIHVDSQGNLYDCDFNYAIALPCPSTESRKLWEVSLADLQERKIATADHCYGCTAGCGSSCGGAIV